MRVSVMRDDVAVEVEVEVDRRHTFGAVRWDALADTHGVAAGEVVELTETERSAAEAEALRKGCKL